jgi:SAM-dependent methyltransferase
VPTNSCILLASEEEARAYPTGDIRLAFCDDCGFIFNAAFDLARTEYSGRYEETQGFSEVFSGFHKALAQRLIDKYALYEKDVLEIGCGKGEFLMLLSELGRNRGTGIDPGVRVERLSGEAASRLTFIQDFYSEKYASRKVDFLACKMTLEHIPAAAEFIGDVRRGLGAQTDTVVFFQIPEAGRILRTCAFEDIYYEHCSYYTKGSLARLFRRAGFEVVALAVEYQDQYLTIEARPASGPPGPPLREEDDLDQTRALVASFAARCGRALDDWRERLGRFRRDGKTVALWGSGSKAVSFLTTLGLADHVQHVTDINPYRHGHFLPTTAHRIVSPEELAQAKPDVVIVMNAIYREEIAANLSKLGVRCELLAL